MYPSLESSPASITTSLASLLAVGEEESVALAALDRAPLRYGALRLQVEKTVSQLSAFGVGGGDTVALALPNGPEMATAFLAVAGCATSAPLNPAFGLVEFERCLESLRATLLVVDAGADTPAREAAGKLGIAVAELQPGAAAGSFDLRCAQWIDGASRGGLAAADDIALVLHTSGTTSRPKIVPLTHANLCASAANVRESLALRSADCCLSIMPLFHIHGLVAGLLASLRAGASIFCAPKFDASDFFAWLHEARPTWYTAVPTMHQAILERAVEQADAAKSAKLRFIRSSSASLPPRVMQALEETFDAPVIEAYGMTEAAHQMASNPLPPRERRPGWVGLAAGPEVAIMDAGGELLPAGGIGEVVIRGANVTAGYLNNTDANETAFADGWFRTGDQGQMDEQGYLRLTGRLKEMINRGGEKVAPREVDEALMTHPAVAQAVVFAVSHPTLGEDVAAAVVLQKSESTSFQELRDFLFDRMAAFKIPSQIVIVDEIPMGPTGKLQRIGLADRLASSLRSEFIEPRNPSEVALARIWTETLGLEGVGCQDNFFAIGGDSLSAARVVARIQTAFGIAFSPETIFREPTLSAQALAVEDAVLDEIETATERDLA